MENILENITVFGDMDGVLARWEKDMPIEEVYKPGYFLNRKPDQTAIDAARILSEKVHFRVLSAAISEQAKEEKREWLHLWAPFLKDEDMIFTEYGKPKSQGFIEKSPYHVLLDDNSEQLRAWHGCTVKYMNGINGTHGTYKGDRVYHMDSGHKVAREILEYAVSQIKKHTA